MQGSPLLRTGLGAVLTLSSPLLMAANSVTMEAGQRTEIRASVGLLDGDSGEYVYDADGSASGIPGYKLSELKWELNNVLMAGLGVSFNVTDSVRINADYWSNAGDGDGTMDDYDWLYVGAPWSHWSHHDDTTVREVTQLDANAEFSFYRMKNDRTRFFALAGFRQDHLDWQSRGGEGIYSIFTFRDAYVTFPNQPVISYEQTYTTPYLGLGIHSQSNAKGVTILMDASIKYSDWVEAEDVDIHHLRDLKFEEDGDDGNWIAYSLNLEFQTSEQYSFLIDYSYQAYDEVKATTTVTDLTDGSKTLYPGDAAGLDHRSSLLSIGMSYRF